jgi:hypothetical protein
MRVCPFGVRSVLKMLEERLMPARLSSRSCNTQVRERVTGLQIATATPFKTRGTVCAAPTVPRSASRCEGRGSVL